MKKIFQYDSDGIPIISKETIESLAKETCRWFDEKILETLSRIDILGIYKKLIDAKKLVLAYEDLNPSQEEKRILGKFCYGTPPRIILDKTHEESASSMRVRFTLAHELGHFVLHRHQKIDNAAVLIDTEEDLPRYFVTPKENRNWVEWQANYFAGALLIQQIPLGKTIKKIQRDMGIMRNFGKIYLDESASNMRDFLRTLGQLASLFDVSKTCMEIRLKQLGILIDKRKNLGEFALSCDIERLFS